MDNRLLSASAPSGRAALLLHWTLVGVKTSFLEMRAHPLRSILSSLGVMIGTAVMVTMLSLSGGVERILNERIGKWMRDINVWSNRDDITSEDRRAASRSPGLQFADGAYLEKTIKDINRQFREISISTLIGDKHARILCVDSASLAQEFDLDQPMEIKEGRSLSQEDFRHGADVCLISTVLADEIRKNGASAGKDTQSVLGSQIDIKNRRYRVIGLFNTIRPQANPDRWWERYNVFIPLLSAQENLTGFNSDPGYLWLQVKDPKEMESTLERLVSAMLARHRGVKDFEYHKPEFLDTFINMIENMSLMFLIVALVALTAGGPWDHECHVKQRIGAGQGNRRPQGPRRRGVPNLRPVPG